MAELGAQVGVGTWLAVVVEVVFARRALALAASIATTAATCAAAAATALVLASRALGIAAWAALSLAWTLAGALAAFTTLATGLAAALFLGRLGGTDALHHFLARRLGGGLHDVAARRLARAAPDGLAPHGDGLGFFALLRAEAFENLHGNLLLGEALDVHHEAFLIHAHQAHGLAFLAGAASAADAVHVVLRDIGNLVVHDMRQVVDVDAARGDVGGHQSADLAALEARQRLRARALALVAVQRHGGDAVLGQVVGHVVGAELGAREHQHLAPVVLLDDVQQHLLFLAAAHGVDDLADPLHRGVARGDLDALRILEQAARQLADFIAERGREQQALLGARQQRQHLLHIVDEAHVEHAVGFVQHQHLNAGEVHETLLLQIQQTPGGGHEHVDAALDAVNLRVHAHATEDHGGVQVKVLAVFAHGFLNLRREFACRRQHQGADGLATELAARGLAFGQTVQQRQGKGGGFAGAGLCAGQQVVAREHERNGLGLDRRRLGIALFLHGLENGRSQLQFVECHEI